MKKLKSFAMSSKINSNLLSFIVALIAILVGLIAIPVHAETRIITKPDVDIVVNIGEGILEVFGYAPPHSKVLLEGQNIYAETVVDKNGYFVFKNTRIRIGKQEVCLRALIYVSASSQPVCFSIPAHKYVKIGPIIIPPIVAMNQLNYNVHDNAVIQGSTVPQSDVTVTFFSSDIGGNNTSGIPLPELSTKSDENGSFSIQVPSNIDQRLRFYAQTRFDDTDSGKSTTLTIDLLPWWLLLMRSLGDLLSSLKDLWPYFLIPLELLILALFMLVRRKRHSELMIIEDSPLVLEKHPLVKTTQNRPSVPR